MSAVFNPHGNRTADGVRIVSQMVVFDNDLKVGRVVEDETSPDMCCGNERHDDGQCLIGGAWFTYHSATCADGKYCRHNHWFRVERPDGSSVTVDGERMGTRHPGSGRSASEAWNEVMDASIRDLLKPDPWGNAGESHE